MRTHVLIPSCLLLCCVACGTERVIEKPVIHEVVRTEWREIPSDLTLPCPKAEIGPEMTYGAALEAWSEDRAAIDACNGKLAGIESLGEGE